MSGNAKDNGKAGGLPRRQFVRISGVAGAAALLAGTGAGENLAAATRSPQGGSRPPGAARCPSPSKACGSPTDSGSRDYLWKTVQVCERKKKKPPSCLRVTPNYVILHGGYRTNHDFLLIPSCRISGIECPFIWGTGAYPFYWNDAWEQAQPHGAAPVKYSGIGLGINSQWVREQDQLHIHMAGILSGVQHQLNKHEKEHKITGNKKEWPKQIVPVEGRDPTTGKKVTHIYRALILPDLNQNLFMLLGKYVPTAKKNKAGQMLVVTPRHPSGFYVLNSEHNLKNHTGTGTGSADVLLVYR